MTASLIKNRLMRFYLGLFYCGVAAVLVLITLPIFWLIDYRKLGNAVKKYSLAVTLVFTFAFVLFTSLQQVLAMTVHPRLAIIAFLVVISLVGCKWRLED